MDPSTDRRKKRSPSRSRQKSRGPKKSKGRDKRHSRSRSDGRDRRSATRDTDVWKAYEPQRIPPAHALQWQGLPAPAQDWQRLSGGDAWRLGPHQPHPGSPPPAWSPMQQGAWAAGPPDADTLEPVEEGAAEV